MSIHSLNAVSPIDGRYASRTKDLQTYFSEAALMHYRVRIEIEYFIALCKTEIPPLKQLSQTETTALRKIYQEFSSEDTKEIKETERITNHDVKAVEYFVKDRLQALGLDKHLEFVHFGLTSQDINNTAIPLAVKESIENVYLPRLTKLEKKIETLANKWRDVPMLARTHGQPATPTRLGKELEVFLVRIQEQKQILLQTKYAAKFGGATGGYNAHIVAYPNQDWLGFGKSFIENTLGLYHSYPTTQIEHYDHLAALFDTLKRINNIILDLNRDFWTYISMEYFHQKIKEGEIGSSAMPHKVNPIDFENSEGNIGIANALFEHFSSKLPVSRLQRDLSDSTVLRNLGVPIGHSLIAISSTIRGLDKLLLSEKAINKDLDNNWAVVAEAIQTILRRESYPKPYEALKELTRKNEAITQQTIQAFIDELEVNEAIKEELRNISPFNYIGL
ncbi:MAG TPA: adenylosuccinate lyase [Flavobacteriaceae bacterium]|nr:adenylosuccinate lyase [Flavobacteriaceae bacterium]